MAHGHRHETQLKKKTPTLTKSQNSSLANTKRAISPQVLSFLPLDTLARLLLLVVLGGHVDSLPGCLGARKCQGTPLRRFGRYITILVSQIWQI